MDHGLYSARFKPELSQKEKNLFILDKMKNAENRQAKFVTCICFIYENGKEIIVKGVCNGSISKVATNKRENSFGYDPIFIPEGYNQTFDEMKLEEKDKISHRAKAIALLKKELEGKK